MPGVIAQLIAVIGLPIDARVALLGASAILLSAVLGVILRRAAACQTPAREGIRMSAQRRAPAMAAIVAETVFAAAGRPEPRAPVRSPSAALT